MTQTLDSADASNFAIVLAFNFIAGVFSFLLARYVRPQQPLSLGRGVSVFVIGWIAGSVVVFTVQQLMHHAGIEIPDAAAVLLSLSVLFLLMDKTWDWVADTHRWALPAGRHKIGPSR
jgi:hypothetical protein